MCFCLSQGLRVPSLEEPGYFVHLFLRQELRNIEFPARDEISEVSFDRTDCQIAFRGNFRDGFSGFVEVETDLLRIGLGRLRRLCGDAFCGAIFPDNADNPRQSASACLCRCRVSSSTKRDPWAEAVPVPAKTGL